MTPRARSGALAPRGRAGRRREPGAAPRHRPASASRRRTRRPPRATLPRHACRHDGRRPPPGDPLAACWDNAAVVGPRADPHRRSSRRSTSDLEVDEEAFVEPPAPPRATTARTASSSAARPARRSTLTDDEHLRARSSWPCSERPDGRTIIAGAGSNDTRHAVHLTERATELGADAMLSRHARTTTSPTAAGIVATTRRSPGPPTSRSSSTTSRRARRSTCPTTCWPSWRRSSTSRASSRPTTTNLAPIDGLGVYAGNDDVLARTLDIGGPAASSSPATSSATRCAGWSTSPSSAPRSTRSLHDVYDGDVRHHQPDPRQGRAEHARPRRRRPAPAARRGRRATSAPQIRAVLERHGLLERPAPA